MSKFAPRQRKNKHRQRDNPDATADTNASELPTVSKSIRDARRQEIRAQLKSQQLQDSKSSKQKQKRLDKYIDKKLRKEENLGLLKKLSSNQFDTTLLRSSRNLGRIHVSRCHAAPSEVNDVQTPNVDPDPESDASEHRSNPERLEAPANPSNFGSGLKRRLETDEAGKPIIKKRKRTKTKAAAFHAAATSPPESFEWNGFSDSENEQGQSISPVDKSSMLRNDHPTSGSEDADSEDVTSSTNGTSDDDDSADQSDDDIGRMRTRTSAFKAWAEEQRNDALDYTPVATFVDSTAPQPIRHVPRPMESDPLPPELDPNAATDNTRKAFSIHINRPTWATDARVKLPIIAEEQKIMEAIHNNACVVVCGATGSGKTTQVPQFLFEAGYGSADSATPATIGITQPRRVAAVSMAKRVSEELGPAGDSVAYQIRFDSTTSSRTAMKFMTDGVLLREIGQDFTLSKYSVIVVDEAHERSVNTDILMGILSRIVNLRASLALEDKSTKPLKLIIMSATLRVSDFTENQSLFKNGPPPVVSAEGRQHPVTIHFARRTHRDYVEEAFNKIIRGHRKLPQGGILVFLTGQNEITRLVHRLRLSLKSTKAEAARADVRVSAGDASLEMGDVDIGPTEFSRDDDLDSDAESEIHGLDDEDEDQQFDIDEGDSPPDVLKAHILPLYSQLPTEQQLKIFEPPPDGSRLIVLATNVAETSLTIPGIRYVFDCGRSKERKYDEETGVQTFEIDWISKASASQRAGRAGRTGPGHCYRLYSSAVFETDFKDHAIPEILRTPIEGVVLQLKSMGLSQVVNFPFPTPPDRKSLARAERLLANLGALSPLGQITPAGRTFALYPLSPRFARMLVLGQSHGCAAHVVTLVAALAIAKIFIEEGQLDDAVHTSAAAALSTRGSPSDSDHDTSFSTRIIDGTDSAQQNRRLSYRRAQVKLSQWDTGSDAIKHLTALGGYLYSSPSDRPQYCEDMFLRPKALQEASQLREQLAALVVQQLHNNSAAAAASIAALNLSKPPQPTKHEFALLKQLVAAGFIDQVAQRADLCPVPPLLEKRPRHAIDVPYMTLFPSSDLRTAPEDKPNDSSRHLVYIHPSSILAHTAAAKLPRYLVYATLQRSVHARPGIVAKVRMHPLGSVSGLQLVALAKGTPLLEWGKPVGKIEVLERGEDGRQRRSCWVVPNLVGRQGEMAWPLPAKRVVQERRGREGWVVVKELDDGP